MAELELVLDCHNTLGEGAVWNGADRRLWWTDIEDCRLWALEPQSGHSASHQTPERVSCCAPRGNGKGLVVAFATGFALYDPTTQIREDIVTFERDQPDTRLNDGRTDRQGRLIAGGFDEKGGGRLISSVVRLDPDLTVTTLFSEVGCANGICFSPDGRTLYFADSMRAEIWAFGYDPDSGRLGERRVVAMLKGNRPGIPDGSCVDAEGCIWNAEWDGSAVVRWTPDGRIDRVVELPVPRPTCVTFGGADYDTLYITTARAWLDEEQLAKAPLSGGLFALRPGVKGVADSPFAG
jgi:sugar lactone lactonase YvrE